MGTESPKPNSTHDIRASQDGDPANGPLRFLRFPAVRARTGLSRTTIWRLERRGDFPQHRRISRNAVAWAEHEVGEWIRAKLGPDPQPAGDDRPTR